MSETPQQKLTAAVVIRNQWPLLTTLLGVFAGLAIVFAEHWRLGCTGIGAAMLWGGFWRAALGPKSGLLQVRGRVIDTILLLGVGAAIVILAWLVPPSKA